MRMLSTAAALAMLAHPPPPGRAVAGAAQVGQAIARAEVVVTDRNGRPAGDLDASDFTLLQNGSPQALTEFRAMAIPLGDRDLDPAGSRTPTDASANPSTGDSRAFVFLIDELHMSTSSEGRRRAEMLVTDSLRALNSNDDVAIRAATENAREYHLTRDLAGQMAEFEILQNDLRLETGRTDWDTDILATLDAVGHALEALTGTSHVRRALVFVSSGINIQQRGPDPRLGPVMRALGRVNQQARLAGVAIYAIDPRGSVGVGVSTAETAFLDQLVAGTGGRVFFNETDMRAVPRRLVEETGTFYLVEFRLEAAAQRQLSFVLKDSRLQARITFRPE